MESQKEQGQRTGAGVGPNDGTGVGNVDAAGAKTAADFFCHPLGIFQTITGTNGKIAAVSMIGLAIVLEILAAVLQGKREKEE